MIPSEGELFKKILGPEWRLLHPDNQRRFDKNPAPGKPLRYEGALNELRASRFGKLLGYLTPGKTYLCHRNNAPNQFDIRIEIRHPLFGLAFVQAGVFRERVAATGEAA